MADSNKCMELDGDADGNAVLTRAVQAAAVAALGTVEATESECLALLVVKQVWRLAALHGADKDPGFGCTETATSTLVKSAEDPQLAPQLDAGLGGKVVPGLMMSTVAGHVKQLNGKSAPGNDTHMAGIAADSGGKQGKELKALWDVHCAESASSVVQRAIEKFDAVQAGLESTMLALDRTTDKVDLIADNVASAKEKVEGLAGSVVSATSLIQLATEKVDCVQDSLDRLVSQGLFEGTIVDWGP